jgi:hypothetical protein
MPHLPVAVHDGDLKFGERDLHNLDAHGTQPYACRWLPSINCSPLTGAGFGC